MQIQELKTKRYLRRRKGVRAKIVGTGARPRLSVFRSNVHIYAQVIDDEKSVTIASASDLKLKGGKMKKSEIAGAVGEAVAKAAIAKKVKKVIFDRNGFRYHGRIKALADGARKGGLEF